MQVRATERGYYGGMIREAGDEFAIADKSELGSWMEVLKPAKRAKPEPTPEPEPAPEPDQADEI